MEHTHLGCVTRTWLGVALALGACSGSGGDGRGASLGAADGGTSDAGESADGGAGSAGDDDAAIDETPDAGNAATPDAEDAASSSEPDASADDAASARCDSTPVTATGCAGGQRSGFTDAARFPGVAACAGSWEGDVKNGAALCATGFHLCRGDDPLLVSLTFTQALQFCGCFAFDAAQDNYNCFSGCSEQAGAGVDSYNNLDMAGVGADCPYQFPGTTGCLPGGRIDATENDGIGCGYAAYLSGVLCCADLE